MSDHRAEVDFPQYDTEYTVRDFTEDPEQIAAALEAGTDLVFYVTITIPGYYDASGSEDDRIALVASQVNGDNTGATIKCANTSLEDEPCPTGTRFQITWNPEGTHTIRRPKW